MNKIHQMESEKEGRQKVSQESKPDVCGVVQHGGLGAKQECVHCVHKHQQWERRPDRLALFMRLHHTVDTVRADTGCHTSTHIQTHTGALNNILDVPLNSTMVRDYVLAFGLEMSL